MGAISEASVEMKLGEALPDIEAIFRAQYARLARVIASVIRDPARAEELAVEVLLKWSRTPQAQGENRKAGCTVLLFELVRTSCAGRSVDAVTKAYFHLAELRQHRRNCSECARSNNGWT